MIYKKLNDVFDELPHKIQVKIRQRFNKKIVIPIKKIFFKGYKLLKNIFNKKV